jgi:hypothetical protein
MRLTKYLNEGFLSWVDSAVGNPLEKVFGTIHLFEGECELDSPNEVTLVFGNGIKNWRITTAPDGMSLLCDNTPLRAYKMGDHGEMVIRDLSAEGIWKDRIGDILVQHYWVFSERAGSIFGLRFDFNSGSSIVITNLGDEIRLLSVLPKKILDEEQVRFLTKDQLK